MCFERTFISGILIRISLDLSSCSADLSARIHLYIRIYRRRFGLRILHRRQARPKFVKMFHPNFINAATAFPFGLQTVAGFEPLTPRSPFSRDGVFFYPPSSPSCSSGGIPSPRLVSPSMTQKKSSFTIEAILGLKEAKTDLSEDVFRSCRPSSPISPASSVKGKHHSHVIPPLSWLLAFDQGSDNSFVLVDCTRAHSLLIATVRQ